MKALVTGAGGLVGSACVELLCERGWEVSGVDNDQRRQFFGDAGSTEATVRFLKDRFSQRYKHAPLDIRDYVGIADLMKSARPDFIIHTAAQPSHDRAAEIPLDDFEVNATGTLNLLQAARQYCPETPFCFTSTNKVYGDNPNRIPVVEKETRYDYADGREGVDESMSIDGCLHSLFGVSKTAADLLCQEYARYFGMPVGIFRGGCLTGARHASVSQHGFLSYIVKCAVRKVPYTVYGYKGKQVRDQLLARDVAHLFLEFFAHPVIGGVFNLGGGRFNSISVLEVIAILRAMGFPLQWTYEERPRLGDHICYISDLTKIQAAFPKWQILASLPTIISGIIAKEKKTLA